MKQPCHSIALTNASSSGSISRTLIRKQQTSFTVCAIILELVEKYLSITDGSSRRAYHSKSPNVFIPILFYDASTSTTPFSAHSFSRARFACGCRAKNNNEPSVDIPHRIQFATRPFLLFYIEILQLNTREKLRKYKPINISPWLADQKRTS